MVCVLVVVAVLCLLELLEDFFYAGLLIYFAGEYKQVVAQAVYVLQHGFIYGAFVGHGEYAALGAAAYGAAYVGLA